MSDQLTLLGVGASAGTPVVGCECNTCKSTNKKNYRTRCSSVLSLKNGKNILIDTSPDLRLQSLREGLKSVDAVLFTHHHADHCHGIDDLRAFCQINKKQIPLYGNQFSMDELNKKFQYAMVEPNGFWETPILKPNVINEPFDLFGLTIEPIPVFHGKSLIHGYRLGNMAYLTDVSKIPDSSMEQLQNLDVLLLDCLRNEPHPTHFSYRESIDVAVELGAKKTFLIHMTHDLEYDALSKKLPESIYVGYDGLKINVN
jgi:phosphoribosyl 1,2-cyclic phosphate phosphodiesterase